MYMYCICIWQSLLEPSQIITITNIRGADCWGTSAVFNGDVNYYAIRQSSYKGYVKEKYEDLNILDLFRSCFQYFIRRENVYVNMSSDRRQPPAPQCIPAVRVQSWLHPHLAAVVTHSCASTPGSPAEPSRRLIAPMLKESGGENDQNNIAH